jgi:benzodiazapine receptor
MEDWTSWYDALAKPSWTPPSAVIGTIWTVLYPIIVVAFGAAVVKVFRGDLPKIVLVPLALNVVSNIAFTPIQFGLRNLPLAAVDIVIVLITIVWTMALVWPNARWIALALVPYLVWVCTATVLQLSITFANR